MRSAGLRRASFLLLVLLMGGGGSGLPLLDAVLHHVGAVRRAGAQMHGCETAATHTERCTLGSALPALLGASGTNPPPHVKVPDTGKPLTARSDAPARSSGDSPALPRAPPHSPA